MSRTGLRRRLLVVLIVPSGAAAHSMVIVKITGVEIRSRPQA